MTTIAHATALTDDDILPFRHAVALAAWSGARLVSVHATGDSPVEGPRPDAAELTTAWGLPAIEHEWLMHDCCDDPVDTTLDALSKLSPDLVVAGTHQREGLARIFRGSHGEALAENVGVPTLLVPLTAHGFVDDDGPHKISKILIPCGDEDAAAAAMACAAWLTRMFELEAVEGFLVHAGARAVAPTLEPPAVPAIRWTWRDVPGAVEDAIATIADEADLVLMTTRGQNSAGDALLGTHTERVARRIHRPILSVPLDWKS